MSLLQSETEQSLIPSAHGVYFIKYATILLQTMTIELDEDFLFALLDFAKFKDAAWKEPTKEYASNRSYDNIRILISNTVSLSNIPLIS